MSAEGGDELMDLDSIPASLPPSPFIFSICSELPDHSASPPTGGLLADDSAGFVSRQEVSFDCLLSNPATADQELLDRCAQLVCGDVALEHSIRCDNLDPSSGKNIEDVGNSRLIQISMGTVTEENDSDSGGSCIIKEMIQQALRSVKDSIEQHFLVQVWAPVKDGSRYVLTTSGQPFALDPHSSGLLQYRSVSLMYLFSVDGKNGFSGLPGRVFRQKLPEWTPNVQYYTSMEYPRRSYALDYNIRGTLALPVFGSGQSCVAVLELILTSQKINFASEVDKVCKALKAVKLKSSDILEHPSRQICNEGRQAALGEILEMLTVICETYELPLAQTWVPCMHRNVLACGGGSKKSCTGIDGICMGQVCLSTTDVAFYVVDAHMWGFRDACVEHHLQKGQGVAGRAFLLHGPCFARDVKNFCKKEYPLVHYARMFGLAACLAICLRSFLTESDDYVVEFFLPASCVDPQDQKELIKRLTTTMRECFRTLRVSADHDLQEDEILDISELKADGSPESKIGSGLLSSVSSSNLNNRRLLEDHWLDVSDNEVGLFQNLQKDVLCEELDNQKHEDKLESTKTQMLISEDKTDHASQRKRGKTEKSISLEVLQQYFSGSLKDAAKSLGVCPTTMKRICRQHGISRWPSRKINKVNRTLTKLKSVIESVHGGEDVLGLSSLNPIYVGSKFASRTRSGSADENLDTPTLLNSSQHSLGGEAHTNILESVCPTQKLDLNTKSFPVEEPSGGASQLVAYEVPDAFMATEPLTPLRGMLIQDSGSYKEFTEVNNLAEDYSQLQLPNAELPHAQASPPQTQTFPPLAASQEVRNVTIKANYKEDIIRFRLPLSSCMVDLAGEISKRLKLDIGTFNVKYLDVDHEWVLATCDSDLRECLEVASSSSRNPIRLSVHDIDANLGSSCESSEE